MYKGYNKIDIKVLCHNCRNKISEAQNTDGQNFTVEQLYNFFYTAPQFVHKRNDHQMVNSIIVKTLLDQHDCSSCLQKIYAYG